MRLTDRVHLIGGSEPGPLMTDPLDSQVYLIRGEDGFAVVDAGAGRSIERILANVVADGLDPTSIRWLFLTHAHADHAGGASAWSDRLPNVRVAMSGESAEWLRQADEEATSVGVARIAGIYPPEFRLRAARIDRELADSETIALGTDLRLRVLATPGHSRGHLAFLLEDGPCRILFSGDALFPGGRILLQDTWDCDVHNALRSVKRLAKLAPAALLAGHLGPVLAGAPAHIALATDRIARLLVPEPLE